MTPIAARLADAPAKPLLSPDWLEALPHASAIVALTGERLAAPWCNRRFTRQIGDWLAL